MIAHVAEAGEGSGRVVLQLGPGPNVADSAIDAAFKIAAAFNSEIESLFIEDAQLFQLSPFPFVRQISFSGHKSEPIRIQDFETELRLAGQSLQRRIASKSRNEKIPVNCRIVRDEPVRALATTCAECGPWNVVVIGEALNAQSSSSLIDIVDHVSDTTGIVLAGPKAQRTTGPIVVIVEDVERLPGQLRASERLSRVTAGETKLLLVSDDDDEAQILEGQVRLALADYPDISIQIATEAFGQPAGLAEIVRRFEPGFVIARFGGLAIPRHDVRTLANAIEAPLFLVR